MATNNWIFYTSTGEVTADSGQYPTNMSTPALNALTPVGGGRLQGVADGEVEYFPGGTRTPRPQIAAQDVYEIPADGTTQVTFALPTGTEVTCLTYELDDVITAGEAFLYTSAIDRIDVFSFATPFPNRDKIVTIEVGSAAELENASDF